MSESSSASADWPGKRLGLPEAGPRSIGRFGRRLGALLIDWGIAYLLSWAFFRPDTYGFATLGIFGVLQVVFLLIVNGLMLYVVSWVVHILPLHGTFVSENIEDYYVSPYELGYGKSISFNHDFIGRAALEQSKDRAARRKVTLVFNPDDVRNIFGSNPDYTLSYARYRVESASSHAGITFYCAYIYPQGTILGLALIAESYAAPGTEVTVIWGESAGPGAASASGAGCHRIRATVQPAPYNEFARTQYRKDNT